MTHRTQRIRSVNAGAGLTEFILIVSLVAVGVMALGQALGRRLTRRVAAAASSLDQGTALRRVPVEIDPYLEGWRLTVCTPNQGELDFWVDSDPATHPAGPRYGNGAYPGKQDPQFVGHTLNNPGGAWRTEDLLNEFTQLDANTYGDKRCAPSCAIAAALQAGPEAFERLVRNLRKQIILGRAPANPAPLNGLGRPEMEEILARIAEKLETQSLTRWEIGLVTDILARFHQADFTEGAGAEASATMMHVGSTGERSAGPVPADGTGFRRWIEENLRPGEVIRSSVDTNGDTDRIRGNHHAILIGRDSRGRIYLYDPFPKVGDQHQMMYRQDDTARFDYYLDEMIHYQTRENGTTEQVVGGKIYSY